MDDKIFCLTRPTGGNGEPQIKGKLLRGDIELFARTGGHILIAPLQAIGRGYNILNSAGKRLLDRFIFSFDHTHILLIRPVFSRS